MSQQPLDPASKRRFNSFSEFYPFYLHQHRNRICRRLHFIGTTLIIVICISVLLTAEWAYLAAVPIAGYGCAWVGHFFFEHNRPATFKHPLYSLCGDFVLFKDMLLGRIER